MATMRLATSGSDSCPSDTEANQSTQKQTREKEAKLRLAALSLISVLAKVCSIYLPYTVDHSVRKISLNLNESV